MRSLCVSSVFCKFINPASALEQLLCFGTCRATCRWSPYLLLGSIELERSYADATVFSRRFVG